MTSQIEEKGLGGFGYIKNDVTYIRVILFAQQIMSNFSDVINELPIINIVWQGKGIICCDIIYEGYS